MLLHGIAYAIGEMYTTSARGGLNERINNIVRNVQMWNKWTVFAPARNQQKKKKNPQIWILSIKTDSAYAWRTQFNSEIFKCEYFGSFDLAYSEKIDDFAALNVMWINVRYQTESFTFLCVLFSLLSMMNDTHTHSFDVESDTRDKAIKINL